MSQAFATETTIKRPIADVWGALTDWERAPEWMEAVESLHADGPTEVGTTLTFVSRGKTHTSEITAVEPGRSFTLTSTQGGVVARYHYRVDPAGDPESARARLAVEVDAHGGWKLIGPLVRRAVRRTDAGQMEDLRAHVEA